MLVLLSWRTVEHALSMVSMMVLRFYQMAHSCKFIHLKGQTHFRYVSAMMFAVAKPAAHKWIFSVKKKHSKIPVPVFCSTTVASEMTIVAEKKAVSEYRTDQHHPMSSAVHGMGLTGKTDRIPQRAKEHPSVSAADNGQSIYQTDVFGGRMREFCSRRCGVSLFCVKSSISAFI